LPQRHHSQDALGGGDDGPSADRVGEEGCLVARTSRRSG